MSELSDLLTQYGQGYADPRLSADSADYSTADVMRRYREPNAFTSGLRTLAEKLPAYDDPEMRRGLQEDWLTWWARTNQQGSLPNVLMHAGRGALNTTANWLDQAPEAGPDTLAPLGGAAMIPLSKGLASAAKHVTPDWTLVSEALRRHWRDNEREYGGGPLGHAVWLGANAASIPALMAGIQHLGFPSLTGRLVTDAALAAPGALVQHGIQTKHIYDRLKEIKERDASPGAIALADSSRASLPGTVVNAVEHTKQHPPEGFDSRVWYHGAIDPFDTFDFSRTGQNYFAQVQPGGPAYFTTDRARAQMFADTAEKLTGRGSAHVKSAYLRKPEVDASGDAMIRNKDDIHFLSARPGIGLLLPSPQNQDVADLLARYGNSF